MCPVASIMSYLLFVTPWTVALQAPLSMGFLGQEYCSGLPFPSPGDIPDPGIETMYPTLAGRFFTHWVTWEAPYKFNINSGNLSSSFSSTWDKSSKIHFLLNIVKGKWSWAGDKGFFAPDFF